HCSIVHRLPAACTTVASGVACGANTTYAVSSVGSLSLLRTKSQRRQSGCHGAARGSHSQSYQRRPFAPSPALNRVQPSAPSAAHLAAPGGAKIFLTGLSRPASQTSSSPEPAIT